MNKLINEYETIIFDCDGVILNSNKIKTQAFYEVTKEFGYEVAQKLVDYHLINGGMSRYMKFKYFITSILKKRYDKILSEKLLINFAKHTKKDLMTCEMVEGLEHLKAKTQATKWLIVSGSDQAELREILKFRGCNKYFEGGIFGSPEDKDTIIKREIKSGNIKRPALFIGDSKNDYIVAKKAKLDFIFLSKWSEVKDYKSWCNYNKIYTAESLLDFIKI